MDLGRTGAVSWLANVLSLEIWAKTSLSITLHCVFPHSVTNATG